MPLNTVGVITTETSTNRNGPQLTVLGVTPITATRVTQDTARGDLGVMKIGEHQALITTETKEHHRIAGEEHRQVTEGRGSAG